jgi:succinyl-CoA synthetase beta subunit
LNEFDSALVLSALGIPFASAQVIARPNEDPSIEFPVVAKVLSADIAHKSDAGGVVLGIKSRAELEAAASSIFERVRAGHPFAVIDGILVQQMEDGLAEVILGFRRDPQVGPVVVLGTGGVLTEIYRDVAVSAAPVGLQAARRMIDDVRGLAVLRGYRGLPAGDTAALANAIVAMSQLAYVEAVEISEVEINPLLVRRQGQGVVGVDGLVVLGPTR